MSATTSKLEMSLDEIIKAQKVGQSQSANKKGGGPAMRGGRQIGSAKGKRGLGVNTNKGGRIVRRQLPVRKFNGTQQKKRIAPVVGRRGPVGNRAGVIRKNVVNNKAMVSATRNLVKKLVKKALVQNLTNTVAPRAKIVAIPANRLRRRTIQLNKVNARSRVIRRRNIISAANPAVGRIVRGRGSVRFAAGPLMRSAPLVAQRRRKSVQYVQQQPTGFVRQPRRVFNPAPQQVSIREQINAMRRAPRLQQLQSQFIKQQGRTVRAKEPAVVQVVRQQQQPFYRPQQVIAMQQRQPRRQQRQQPQQIIILQQAPRRQQQKQQFFRPAVGRPRGQRSQQIMVEPFFTPPNFLQRL